jgi:hypothetical protein
MVEPAARSPRFKVGDHVIVVGVGNSAVRGTRGIITELLPVDVVYRYRVRFNDDSSSVFYGFELEHASSPLPEL